MAKEGGGGKPGLPAEPITSWFAEMQARKVAALAEIRAVTGRRQMSWDDFAAIVVALGDLVRLILQ